MAEEKKKKTDLVIHEEHVSRVPDERGGVYWREKKK